MYHMFFQLGNKLLNKSRHFHLTTNFKSKKSPNAILSNILYFLNVEEKYLIFFTSIASENINNNIFSCYLNYILLSMFLSLLWQVSRNFTLWTLSVLLEVFRIVWMSVLAEGLAWKTANIQGWHILKSFVSKLIHTENTFYMFVLFHC